MQELTPFIPLKLLRHSDRVEAMLRGDVVYPVSVEIDLANICNHGCPWCSFNGFRQENWVKFPGPRVLALIDELADVGVKSITFTGGGEPLVHNQAAEIFLTTHARGIEYGVVTNGRRMEGQVAKVIADTAKFVRVSLDAGTPQSHQLLHATATPEFFRILANMRQVRNLAGDCLTIGASFCVFDVNVHEINDAARLVKEAGGNYLEVRPVFPTEWRGGGFANPLTESHVEAARAWLSGAQLDYNDATFRVIGMIHRFDQVSDRSKPYKACHSGQLTTVINADGYIYHCCQQRGMPAFRAGSVLNAPFREVWWNAQHQQMVQDIDVSKCPPCRYDGYNRIIEEAYMEDAMHANFL